MRDNGVYIMGGGYVKMRIWNDALLLPYRYCTINYGIMSQYKSDGRANELRDKYKIFIGEETSPP